MSKDGCRSSPSSSREPGHDPVPLRRVQVQAPLAGRGRSRRSDLRGDDQPGRGDPLGNGQRFRVLEVVPFEEEDESPFVGLLQVEGA